MKHPKLANLKYIVNICTLIGKLRILAGYSIVEAADYAELTVKELSDIEAGLNLAVDFNLIVSLCHLYGVDVEKLVA
ncbi:helix-turn-helix domain-containing protein [Macrococcus lamae]|uniref:XRE family transcriptional regulator n=1 Tax=Macrococcus lamae TaxID=198484 RepID=A0A4R6BUP8_9STAP|nr:helix-turn-helix transcriptional regulator [Macrococcus lamae]TDM11955.1 XRE family transcriptional regulator [Macrococcus lamae]